MQSLWLLLISLPVLVHAQCQFSRNRVYGYFQLSTGYLTGSAGSYHGCSFYAQGNLTFSNVSDARDVPQGVDKDVGPAEHV